MAKKYDALMAFVYSRIKDATPQRMVWKLSVEGMQEEELTDALREDLTAFRHLRTDARLRKAEQWFTNAGRNR